MTNITATPITSPPPPPPPSPSPPPSSSSSSSFTTNISTLSNLCTSRISLSGHSLSLCLPPSESRLLQALDAFASLASHSTRTRVVVSSQIRPHRIDLYFCSSTPLAPDARDRVHRIAWILARADVAFEERVSMLAEGGPPYLGPAARMLLEALDWYWVRAGPELALGLVEVVEDVGGEAAEGEDGAKKQQRAWGNHAELHLAEYLLQRGARRVDIGTPLGKGLCWLCEMWFKGLMKVAAPELVVRTWNYSGVCRKEWRMPRWWRIRRAEDGEEREIQSLVIKFVEDAVVEYIAKAKRMLREKSEDDDEDSDEDEDEDDEDEDGEDESDASSVYEDHEEDGANRVRSLED